MAPSERGFLGNRTVRTSFLQSLPFARRRYRSYLPLMPLAIESFDLGGYDLVISSSFCVAKGVLSTPNQVHVSYVHSPMRFAWDLQHQYLRQHNLERGLRGLLARKLLSDLRSWDYRTANGVDQFISNSHFIARRIWKVYRRESIVIHPPVDTEYFQPARDEREDFYLTTGRLVPYKCTRLLIEAFAAMPERRLVVIGDGPEYARLRAIAPRNVEMLGHQPTAVVRDHMQRTRAFLFAALEDFGIAPVEAQACGTPVIAFGDGGVTESVIDGKTGVFFGEQTSASLLEALQRFERRAGRFSTPEIRANAQRFGTERFKQQLRACIDKQLNPAALAELAVG